jgi:putative ABC transport system substrate-binding protein
MRIDDLSKKSSSHRFSRRPVLIALLTSPILSWASPLLAQAPAKMRRIGLLTMFSASDPLPAPFLAFLRDLRELGWVEGKNISIEYRFAEGRPERLPDLAADLVRLKVDIILAAGTADARAAKQATATIPIVVVNAGDPVASGLVASLSRPGGNVTGLSQMALDLAGKRLELLKDLVPKVTRIAVLGVSQGQGPERTRKELQLSAAKLGIELELVDVRRFDDFDKAFADIARMGVGALSLQWITEFHRNPKRVADYVAKLRLPAIAEFSEFVEAGGLLSYGPDWGHRWTRAATYVDKILKGAKPADLPIEQPTKFELALNMKTAKAFGITVPPIIMVRVDRVIE